MRKKENNPDLFLNAAEQVIRESVRSESGLVVWRGKYSHQDYPVTNPGYISERDTIIVGMSDAGANKLPKISVMKVSLDCRMAVIEFSMNSLIESHLMPFGGGWYPLRKVMEYAKQLQSL